MEWHILKNIKKNDAGGSFLLNCKFKNSVLYLQVLQNTVAWSSEIQQDSIDAFACKMKMDTLDYLKNLKEYLSSDNAEYKFAKSEFILQYILSGNMKVKYLQCKLLKVQNILECVGNLLQSMYEEKNSAAKEVISLKLERDQLKLNTQELQTKLTEFISRKKKEEDILYSNFVLVLNEKKARIQHLTELLEAFRHGRPTVNPSPVVRGKTKTSRVEVKNEAVSESDSEKSEPDSEQGESDYNTDEEKSKINEKDNENVKIQVDDFFNAPEQNQPSTSKGFSFSSILDDSLSSHTLPKRVKYTHNVENCNNFNKELSSKKPASKIKAETTRIDEESPIVNFSTQDLLDDI